MKRRLFALPLIAVAAALTLAGAHARLHAQEIRLKPNTAVRPNLRNWMFPGMIAQSSHDGPQIATLTGHAGQHYAEALDYYAKRLGASNYDLKTLTTFQPPNHSLLSDLGLNYDAVSSCYVNSQNMNATLCRRYAHEMVSVSLSTDRQSHETYIFLTDTTY